MMPFTSERKGTKRGEEREMGRKEGQGWYTRKHGDA
jgi:hypothetical protein